jgi:O-6-methylguanine DNA methyltransferase
MTSRSTFADVELETALAGLRVRAPSTLAGTTLVAVGLADEYATMASPIGPVFVAWNGRGVSTVAAAGDPEEFESRFRAEVRRPIRHAAAIPAALERALSRRLAGDRRVTIALDLRNRTEFERAVLAKALEIPRGEVRPYGWVAAEIGRPNNPIPLVIPCHRVVRSDGLIGEYSLGGASNKRTILAAEGLDPDEMERVARAGVRFIGSDTTRIYCLPSCHSAQRITPAHRVPFRGAADPEAAGYRACRACRPDASLRAA